MSRSFRENLNTLGSVFLLYFVQQCMLTTLCKGTVFNVSFGGSYGNLQKGTVLISKDGGQARKLCPVFALSDEWKFASVVCRQLGHGPPVIAKIKFDGTVTYFNSFNSGYLTCNGKEATLSDCRYHRTNDANLALCSNYALEVKCLPNTASEFSVAISDNGDEEGGGTVFTFANGRWGPICIEDFRYYDVILTVCKQLGFKDGNSTLGGMSFEDPVLYLGYCGFFIVDSIEYCPREYITAECFVDQIILQGYCFNDTSDDYIRIGSGPNTAVVSLSGVVIFILLSSCVGGICYCCKKSNEREENESNFPQSTTTMTSVPLVHPPPPYNVGPPMVHPPPGSHAGYQMVPTSPPGQGYPPTAGPGYPPAAGPGYPPAAGPGYPPPAAGPGYPPAAVPPPAGPGYSQQEKPPMTAPSYPSSAGPGYPTQSGPAPISGQPQGYPAGATSEDIQLKPYPVNEKQGPL